MVMVMVKVMVMVIKVVFFLDALASLERVGRSVGRWFIVSNSGQ